MSSWREAVPQSDGHGLYILGEQVVSRDEAYVQRVLAQEAVKACGDSGRLLETGYGLGMSSESLGRGLRSRHWIVEGNYWLASAMMSDLSLRDSCIVSGLWEEFVVGVADGFFANVYFDPYVFDFQVGQDATWQERFIFAIRQGGTDIFRVVEPGGKIFFLNFAPELGDEWAQRLSSRNV